MNSSANFALPTLFLVLPDKLDIKGPYQGMSYIHVFQEKGILLQKANSFL